MSDEAPPPSSDTPPLMRLLAIGTAAVSGVLLLIAIMLSLLVVSLANDVATLTDQSRKSAKATKALQDELASIKALLIQPVPAAATATPAPPKPTNIDAADPRHDCVVSASDPKALAKCMGGAAGH